MLLLDLTDCHNDDYDYDQETKDEYWAASRRILLTAVTIAQQGIEFILKGFIAETSPYLLIQDPAVKVRSTALTNNIVFSDFKTIDAQDLVSMVGAFTNKNLSDSFRHRFKELRKLRNKITHSTAKDVTIEPATLIEIILEVHSQLLPNSHWPTDRMNFLDRKPIAHLGDSEFTRNTVCRELETVLDVLNPAKVKKYFNIDKKQRRYSCPGCLSSANRDAGFEHQLAVLTPKSPTATSVFCFVCNQTYAVERTLCTNSDCKGNVFHDEWECLSCAL